MPIPSPFHARTSVLCKSLFWKEWAGYYAVRAFDTVLEPEYQAIRHTAGLLDVTPLYKYEVEGRDAAAFLSWVTVRDITKLAVGRMTYLCWCDDAGKVVDDGTVARLDADRFRVTAAEPAFAWLLRHARGFDVHIEDITSWNEGAERIYGFTKEEAIGKYLPFIPEFLMDPEWENNRKIRNGEVLKRVETFPKRKDGTIISVSLTLSPIKNAAGEIIGISGISRDISEKKNVEKELVRRNQELSRIFFISSAMRGTLDLDRLMRMVLTAVTMGDGLGFNRAILFLVDEEMRILRGAMAVVLRPMKTQKEEIAMP